MENGKEITNVPERPTITFTRSKLKKKYLVGFGAFLMAVAMLVTISMTLDGQLNSASNSVRSVQKQLKKPPTVTSSANKVFEKAAVTSDAGVCSDIGSEILKKNGSAVDSAIATLLCLGLFVPQSMGIGGGFFMTIYNRKSGTATVIDSREMAPLASDENMYHGNGTISEKGPLSVAVPAQVRGLELAYKLYGRLPWNELFEPTVNLCKNGVLVPNALAKSLNSSKADILADPGLRDVFVDKMTGDVLQENDTLRMPQLGETLNTIATQGADVLYKGPLAQQLVDEINQMGGIITMEDFANYTALKKDPITFELSDGLRIFNVPPPASGTVFSEILLILDGYNLNNRSRDNLEDAIITYHRIIEAFKYSYAKRTELGDDQFVDMTQLVKNSTSKEYTESIRELIWDNRTFPSEYYGPDFGEEDHGTSHMSIVSPDGDAVSVTTTINLLFGSKILSPSTGIILNDEMDDFSSPNVTNFFNVPPSPNNFIEPTKRPVSSICAAIAVDSQGDVQLVTGAAGGTIITTATAYTTIINLWLGDDIVVATDTPRLHHQLYPPTISYEQGFPEDILDGLVAIGHNVTLSDRKAVVNAIRRISDDRLQACSDGRKGGNVSGF